MIKRLPLVALISTLVIIPLALPDLALAQSIVDNTTSDYQTGNYDLNDMVLLAIRASRIILGLVGSLALLMFIYGGLMFLISSGSSEKVTKAKNIIIAAAIGLIIVFTSFVIIRFVLEMMGISWNGIYTPGK
ncbi:hypothetical protein CVU83_03225 [Candidatus Falkowbacteria bacterium HGW-Falkowbacteria-2]|uniref:Uncharacterized protein n=1 Tax=Candidatus Falkowbacteria bacterium HGW-Falkowbacteria-2 TaxID=2013769 RepID=A0A2N2DXQ1_9BACT|nr:MAG: hypothetical protein CVU83_03225 [Candidatus Falkowbacteria bacterium HGW-Falkowbacteria-2]